VFQKSYTRNILGIGRNKSQNSYFSRSITESKGETEWCQEAAAPCHGAAPLGRAGLWCGPLAHLLTPPFRLYNPLDGKTLRDRSIFHETYYKPPSSSTRDWEGPKALLGTLLERGITAGGLLHHHGRLLHLVLHV
jgi:hypothetical protein